MTDSRRVPAGTLLTSTNATNGSGNLFVYFKDLLQSVSIYFVALLSSIVAEFQFLVYHIKKNPAKCRVFVDVVQNTYRQRPQWQSHSCSERTVVMIAVVCFISVLYMILDKKSKKNPPNSGLLDKLSLY